MFGNDNLNMYVVMIYCEGIVEKNRNFFGKVEIFIFFFFYIIFIMNFDLFFWG